MRAPLLPRYGYQDGRNRCLTIGVADPVDDRITAGKAAGWHAHDGAVGFPGRGAAGFARILARFMMILGLLLVETVLNVLTY